jgi:hypothetical protein
MYYEKLLHYLHFPVITVSLYGTYCDGMTDTVNSPSDGFIVIIVYVL